MLQTVVLLNQNTGNINSFFIFKLFFFLTEEYDWFVSVPIWLKQAIQMGGLDAQDGTGDSTCLSHTQQFACSLDIINFIW